ncbi:hypothetical protein MKX07_004828 [Trichoderma sp. CBMAI-0711]|nr:hypothetical protein MKX07_004828 [Trichoderma sp. CBMAI-0711]
MSEVRLHAREFAADLGNDFVEGQHPWYRLALRMWGLTVQSNNAEDEDQGQNKDNNRVNLQSGRLVRVESYIRSPR